jgi:UDP-N-acetylglucosamine 1-carboxyvinyltransferase
MPEQFVVQGSKLLKGEIEVRGAKNAAFPLLAATLLTGQPCLIKNLPLIEDVFRMIEILKSLGAKVSWEGEREVRICCQGIDPAKIEKEVVSTLRGSILFYGALLARLGRISLPQPGGCVIGARPIDTHLDAFSQLGIKVTQEGNLLDLEKTERVKRTEILLQEFSPTATCNALLFASLLPQTTVIKIADQDYQVQELLRALSKMGVKVKKIGHHEIIIEGKKALKGFSHTLIADPIEAGTFIVLAAATKGNIMVKNVPLEFLELFLKKMKIAGLPLKIHSQKKTVKILPWKTLKLEKIQGLPWPGIHVDLLSAIAVLATQAEGSTLIHDPIYEGRFKYLEELNRMGAKIFFADPHRVIIQGPTPLFGRKLGSIDLRGGAALIIAALAAQGMSIVDNVYQIDRGYEKIEERLQKIGADIRRVKE